MKKICVFIFFTYITLLSYSQTITGTYKGELYQEPGETFYFEIRIDKADSKGNISGTTYIESYGKNYSQKGDFGTINFTGSYVGSKVTINETGIVKELKKSSNFYWCIKTCILTLSKTDTKWKLSGPWSASGGCKPGTITVSKTVEKKTEPVVIKKDSVKTEPVVIVKDTVKIKPDPQVVRIDTLENRVVETKDQVNVTSRTVTVEVWDHNLIDGDIISLNLNGDWILESYAIQKEKKVISLNLNQGENTLILHAINLGSSPPNTASMTITDGTNTKTLVLNSDKGKSEAVKIIVQ